MTEINATIKGVPELERKLTFLELQAWPKAAAKTLNSVATTVRAEQARAIKDEMGLSRVGDVKRRIKIRKARANKLLVRLEYRGKPLNLSEFKARQLKKGVKAQPWGRKKLYKAAFIVRIGGNDLVFRREKGKKGTGATAASLRAAAIAAATGKKTSTDRLPIDAMWGPGIADTAARSDIQKIRERTVARVLTDRLRSNLDYELSKITRRR